MKTTIGRRRRHLPPLLGVPPGYQYSVRRRRRVRRLESFGPWQANDLPLLTTLNRLIQVLHALFNISIEHVVDVYLLPAPLYDLVRYFSQEALHSLLVVVELTQFPDDSH